MMEETRLEPLEGVMPVHTGMMTTFRGVPLIGLLKRRLINWTPKVPDVYFHGENTQTTTISFDANAGEFSTEGTPAIADFDASIVISGAATTHSYEVT